MNGIERLGRKVVPRTTARRVPLATRKERSRRMNVDIQCILEQPSTIQHALFPFSRLSQQGSQMDQPLSPPYFVDLNKPVKITAKLRRETSAANSRRDSWGKQGDFIWEVPRAIRAVPINQSSPPATRHDNQVTAAYCRYKPFQYTIDKVDGSEEIEFTTAYDVFVRAGFETTICGVNLQNPPMAKFVVATCRS